MEDRLPIARNPMTYAAEIADSVIKRPQSTELLMTSVPAVDGLDIRQISGIFTGRIPLRTSNIRSWPQEKMPHLQCLHCGGSCDAGPPVPAVKQYDSQLDQFWVFGPFCRPCCAFGAICEVDSTSKQLAPTAEILRRYFGVNKINIAPPRASHWRFGGPLGDSQFYGHSTYSSIGVLQPPFVTFANYVVGVHKELNNENQSTIALLPQSAGRLINIQRPEVRVEPLAEKKPTGKVPLILEFLALQTKVSDPTQFIQSKQSKKRKASETVETTNFLKQYVKKTDS
jgi:hypothetical protein